MAAITDAQLRALFGQHCACRPLDLARAGDDHAAGHDCDTGILFDIQIALAIWDATPEVRQACRDRCAAIWYAPKSLRGPDARGPCCNDDCMRCYPNQRWFRVSTDTVERRRHERKLQAASAEAARTAYDAGTAWPSGYDSDTLEILETAETCVEEISSPWLHRRDDGSVLDVAGCAWDQTEPAGPSAGSNDDFEGTL